MQEKCRGLVVAALLLGLGLVGLQAAPASDEPAVKWKKLGKMRVLPGVWISRSQNMRWGFHMKEIKRTLEKAAFDLPVKIELVLDGGMKVNLGSYVPDGRTDVSPDVRWSTIPNLVEHYEDVRFTTMGMYPLQFYDEEGKKRATIRVQVVRE